MGHQQMDLIFAALDDATLEEVYSALASRIHDRDVRGYDHERAVQQYLAIVVERELRQISPPPPASEA